MIWFPPAAMASVQGLRMWSASQLSIKCDTLCKFLKLYACTKRIMQQDLFRVLGLYRVSISHLVRTVHANLAL